LKLIVDERYGSRYFSPARAGGESPIADDAELKILQTILESLTALDRRVEAVDRKVEAVDHKVTRQHAILTQDVRMIRAAIHDMREAGVTKGEVAALHEDVNRAQQGLDDLAMRVEILEGQRQD
jgi:hypothetical protein